MKSVFGRIALLSLVAICSPVYAQTYALAPAFEQQFLDNNGNPLANGFVVSCVAGLSCAYPTPGNPQTTYTDSSAFTANPDPVPLNAAGRANIWLNTSLFYKFVLVDSAGVTIKTVDNVSAAVGGGGTASNYWTLSGTTISNNNGGGAGNVSIGGGLTVTNDVQVGQNIKLRDAQVSANYANIRAALNMVADVTWRWPATDAAGCLSSDGIGNLSFTTCGGGGGGGTPGGNTSSIQYNNGGTFAGSDNFQWQNANQRIVLTAASGSVPGVVVLNGWIQADKGFLAVNQASPSTPLNYNIFQAPTGGMHALSFTADNYIESGSSAGVPSATTAESGFPHAGAMYCDTTSSPCTEKLYNGSAWISLATGGATSPGGSTTNIQYNSAGSFGGSANLFWTNASQLFTVTGTALTAPAIHVGTGYVESDAGFLALPGTATGFNAIRAPSGGMQANSFTATTYVQTGKSAGPFSSSPPTPTNSDSFQPGTMSWDVASGTEQVYNGSSWVPLGGSGGTPGGPTTSIQFNNAGSFLGSTNFTWNNTTRVVAINGIASTPGLVVLNAYAQADIGFLAVNSGAPSTPLTYNAIQAPTGGVYANSLRAIRYTQTGNSSGIPAVTTSDTFTAGAMYYDTGLGAQRVFNGSTWTSLATAAAAGLNTYVQFNDGGVFGGQSNFYFVKASGQVVSTVVQALAAGAATAFSNGSGSWVSRGDGTSSGVNFEATSSGLNNGFSNSAHTFSVNGNGLVLASGISAGTIQATGSLAFSNFVGSFNVTSAGQATATNFVATATGTSLVWNSGNIVMNGQGDVGIGRNLGVVGDMDVTGVYRQNGTGTRVVINASGAFVGPGVNVGPVGGVGGRGFNPYDSGAVLWNGQDYNIGFNSSTQKLTRNGTDVNGLKFVGGILVGTF